MTTSSPRRLGRVRRAAVYAAAARRRLEEAVCEARADGATLREIAAASGLNHETVRTLTRREPSA